MWLTGSQTEGEPEVGSLLDDPLLKWSLLHSHPLSDLPLVSEEAATQPQEMLYLFVPVLQSEEVQTRVKDGEPDPRERAVNSGN